MRWGQNGSRAEGNVCGAPGAPAGRACSSSPRYIYPGRLCAAGVRAAGSTFGIAEMPPRHPGLERQKRNAPAGTQARPLTSARRTCAPARALGHVQRRPIKLCESSTSGNRRRRSANKVAPIAIPTALPAALLARSQLRSQRAPSALPIAYPPCGPGHLRRQHSNEIHVLTAAADLRPGLRSCNHVRLRPALPSARRSAPVRSAFASAFASTFTSASFAPFEMLAAHLRHVSSLFFPTTTLGDSPRRKPPAPAPPRGRGSYTATPRPAPAAGSAVPAARALHDYAPETGNRHFERPPMRVCVTSRRALPRWAQAAGERPGDSRGWFMGVTVTATRAVIVAVTASTRRIVCGSRKKKTPRTCGAGYADEHHVARRTPAVISDRFGTRPCSKQQQLCAIYARELRGPVSVAPSPLQELVFACRGAPTHPTQARRRAGAQAPGICQFPEAREARPV